MIGQVPVPADWGPYAVLATVVVGLAIGFAAAVNWLDKRNVAAVAVAKAEAEKTKAELEQRLAHLEEQVSRLENGHAKAVGLIVEALSMLDPDEKDVAAKLVEATQALA